MRSQGAEMVRRVFPLLLVFGLFMGTAWAASNPFVGQWILHPSRSQLTDEMKVTKQGQNKYAFDFGGEKPEIIVLDGTDQPGNDGTTLSVAPEGPNWKVVRKKGGRVLLEAIWTLSKDGRSLTDDFTSFDRGRPPVNIKYLYKQMARGASGFAGDWLSTSEAVGSAITIRIRPYQNGGLAITNSGGKTTMKFDGKSARRLGPGAMEIMQKSEGKLVQTRQFEVSRDHKTLTITTRIVGRSAPNVLVFERQ